MDVLIIDTIINIVFYLCDKDKIKFLSLSKELHILKNKVYYDDVVSTDEICHLSYYDRFTTIISDTKYKLPASVTHLTFGYYFDNNRLYIIPISVTHLTFDVVLIRSL